jgi:hydrogenase-4 component B
VMLIILNKTLLDVSSLSVRGLATNDWYTLAFSTGQSSGDFSTSSTLVLLVGGAVLAGGLYYLFGREKIAVGETWTCGIVPDSHMEYTATGFSKSIRVVFKRIVHPHYETLVNANEQKYHGQKLFYHVRIQYLFVSLLYGPIQGQIMKGARWMKNIQTGNVQRYVGYIMGITVLILIWSTGW